MTGTLFAIVAIVCLFATAAPAQSFATLERRIDAGDRVRVHLRSGEAASGKFIRSGADTIAIDSGSGERTFAASDVRRIDVRKRSAAYGALIGLAAGAAWGASQECTGGGEHKECGEGLLMGGGFGAGLGAIAGTLVPRMSTVYEAPGPRASITALVSQHRIGLQARIRW